MSENKARMVIASVRRRRKKSNKTDLELLDESQIESICGAVITFGLCYASIDIVIQHTQIGSIFLVAFGIAFYLLLNRLGQCIATKRILFQKKQFNLD